MTEQSLPDHNEFPELNRVAIVDTLSMFYDDMDLLEWIDLDNSGVIDKLRYYADDLKIGIDDLTALFDQEELKGIRELTDEV